METTTVNLDQAIGAFITEHPWVILLFLIILALKGLALWQAAERKQKIWFVAILIVNTFGLLEIIYLLYNYWKKRQTSPTE